MKLAQIASGQSRNALLSTAAYALALALLLAIGIGACASLWQSWSDYTSAAENLDHLRARKGLAGLRFTTQPPAGSAYIEGQTATVAGAALQQRIGSTIADAGGAVLSSELDLNKAGADGGRIALTVTCDIDQPGLQRALYEIESGMPVMTVDRLSVQTAGGDEKSAAPRLRVQISVSGAWRATP